MKTKSSALSAFSNPRVLAAVVICLAGFTLGFFAFVAKASSPVVIVVNTLSDENTPFDGVCSLREAITNANNKTQSYPECAGGSGANAIAFSVSGTITLGSTLPAINADVTIDGDGHNITISGSNGVQVMLVNSGKTLTLHNLTIANGLSASGGGISNSGTVNVINSTFSGNSASNNNGNGGGGGIYNGYGSTLYVANSTFSGNSAVNGGGGIINFGTSSTLNVSNSTFSGNTAPFGGGIANYGTANVTNSTFSGNSSAFGDLGGGTATLKNTILANSTSGGNCATLRQPVNADSHNLADDATCGGATQATSAQINLQPLANNGGPTQTMALGPGSVAIDAGDENTCAASPVNEFDQRGVARPLDGNLDGIAICDTGAYELDEVSNRLRVTDILRLPNGYIQLDCAGVPNFPFSVYAADLLNGVFQRVFSTTANSNGSFQYDDQSPGAKRFYKLHYP